MPGKILLTTDVIETPSDIFLTPHGLLLVEAVPAPSPWHDPEAGRRVAAALAESPARGLLHLGTRELNVLLPAAAAWWREFTRRYLTQLCHTPELEQARTVAALPPPSETDWAAQIETAPSMRGGEYLNSPSAKRPGFARIEGFPSSERLPPSETRGKKVRNAPCRPANTA